MLTCLLAYFFSIQHRADRLHSSCDALSRSSCVEADCKYCEKMENRYESENEERRSFGMVSVHRSRQIYSSISSRSRTGLVQKSYPCFSTSEVLRLHISFCVIGERQ